MLILALDTATRWVGMALRRDQITLAEMGWQTANRHSAEVPPALQELLRRASVAPLELQAIAVMRGPGSFTGLRIGMSLAKGMALASDPPLTLIGIPTLDVVAAGIPQREGFDILCALVQAGRGRLSAGLYGRVASGWRAQGEAFLATWPELTDRLTSPTLVGGEIDPDGYAHLEQQAGRLVPAGPAFNVRRAAVLADLAAERIAAGQVDDPATLAPEYLH
jgi:tRNA threonylcarbamoyladenosine biosynthesis protein TsaB